MELSLQQLTLTDRKTSLTSSAENLRQKLKCLSLAEPDQQLEREVEYIDDQQLNAQQHDDQQRNEQQHDDLQLNAQQHDEPHLYTQQRDDQQHELEDEEIERHHEQPSSDSLPIITSFFTLAQQKDILDHSPDNLPVVTSYDSIPHLQQTIISIKQSFNLSSSI